MSQGPNTFRSLPLRLRLARRKRLRLRRRNRQSLIPHPLLLLILLFIVIGTSGLFEELVRRGVSQQGSALLQAELSISNVNIDLLPPGVSLQGLKIIQNEPPGLDEPLVVLAVERASISLRPTNLLKEIQLGGAQLHGVDAHLRLNNGSFLDLPGLDALLDPVSEETPTATPTDKAGSESDFAFPDVHLGHFDLQSVNIKVEELGQGWAGLITALGAEASFVKGTELAHALLTVGTLQFQKDPINETLQSLMLVVHGEENGKRLKIERLKLEGDGLALETSGWLRLPGEKSPSMTPSAVDAPDDPLKFLAGITARLDVDTSLKLAAINRFVPDLPIFEGEVDLEATLGIDGPNVSGEGVLLADGVAVTAGRTRYYVGDARLPLQANRQQATLVGGTIEAGGGAVGVTATLAFEADFPLQAVVDLSDVELAALIGDLGLSGSWVTSGLDGIISLSGTLNPFLLTGNGDLGLDAFKVLGGSWEDPSNYADPMLALDKISVVTPIVIDDKSVFVNQALLTSGGTKVYGDIRFAYDMSLDIDLDISAVDLGQMAPIAGLDLQGKGWGRARVWGPISNLTIITKLSLFSASIDFLSLGDLDGTIVVPLNTMSFIEGLKTAKNEKRVTAFLEGYDLTAAAVDQLLASSAQVNQRYYDGRYGPGEEMATLFIQDILGRYKTTPYSGHVGVYFGDELILHTDVDIKDGQVSDLLEVGAVDLGEESPLQGGISGGVQISGPIDRLDGLFEGIVVTHGAAYGEKFERLELDGRMEHGDLFVERAVMENGKGLVLAAGSLATDGVVGLTLQVEALPLLDIDSLIDANLPLAGQLDVDLTVLGSLDNPMIQGKIIAEGISYGELALGEMRLDLNTIGGTLVVEGGLGDKIHTNIEVGFSPGMPVSALVQVQDLPLDPFMDLNAHGQRLTSGVGFSLQAKGELSPEEGSNSPFYVDARLDQFFVDRGRLRIQNYGPAYVIVRNGDVNVHGLQLVGPGTDLGIDGQLRADGSLDFTALGDLNLALLDVLIAGVFQRVEGSLTGEGGAAQLYLTGTTDALRLNGEGIIKNMAVRAEDFPQTVDSIDSDFVIDDNLIKLSHLRASMGGGKIEGGGELLLGDDFIPLNYDLHFQADEVVIRYPDYLPPAQIHGNLALEGPADTLLMSGDLIIDRAVYRERINWEKDLLTFRPNYLESLAYEEAGPPLMYFDIRMRADETLYMRNNVGNLQMSCDLSIVGDTSLMGVTGQVLLDRGKIYLLNNELDIVSGVIVFPDYREFNPYMDLDLQMEIETYSINYRLQGTFEDYQISSGSDSGLAERDINSLLAFGVLADDLQGANATAVAQPALEFLVGSLGLQEQVEGVVPLDLDRFGVVPVLSASGSTSVRFYGEKELTEDKLFTSFQYDVGVTQDYQFVLEYKVSDTFSVIGDADQGRQLNAARVPNIGGRVKFKWEFQ